MLYREEWSRPRFNPANDPMDVRSLVAWLETKDPAEPYDWNNGRHCLMAQYMRAHGFRLIAMGAMSFSYWKPGFFARLFMRVGGKRLPPGFNRIAQEHPRNFGAALDRARELQRLREWQQAA